MMHRTVTLFAIAVVLLAGCTGAPTSTSGDGSEPLTATTASPSGTTPMDTTTGAPSTDEPTGETGCDAADRTTDDGTEELTPKPHPDRPDSLSAETAGSYASAFEEAYAWNGALGDGVESITVRATVTNVTRADEGYVVILDVHAGYTEIVTPDGGTPIEQIADDWYDAAYFVNDSTLRRSVSRSGSDALHARNGSVVGC